jgi:DnaJ-class molecular chaperone
MAFLTQIEAALFLGLRLETVEYLSMTCPKKGQQRTLKFVNSEAGKTYDESELESYRDYLNEPWPLPKSGKRPAIPKAFQDDIKEESHHGCAICGHMDNGEIAHIEPVATTLNNAPGNLIYLCPNHHTKYDFGFKVDSNVTDEEIKAAKLVKQNARRRVMKYEALATKSLISLISFVRTLEKNITSAQTENLKTIHLSEMTSLLAAVPDLIKASQAEAKADKLTSEPERALAKVAPKLAAIAAAVPAKQTEKSVRAKAQELFSEVEDVLIDIDEVECPHCAGRGLTGLAGDFCRYCRGSCFLSEAKRDAYDPDDIDEVECPRCHGRGTKGLVSDLCAYCRGSCVVSQAKADAYEPDEIDEVECPHCNGRGTTGLVDDLCAFCKGSCVVTRAKRDGYDRKEIDEVDCPHCNGRGTTGLVNDVCAFCKGSCVVSRARRKAYDPDEIDEVECPR